MHHSLKLVFSILILNFFCFYKTQIQMYNVPSALASALRQRMRHSLEQGGFPPFLPFLSSPLYSSSHFTLYFSFFTPHPPFPPCPLLSPSLTSSSLRDAKSTRGQKEAAFTIKNFLFLLFGKSKVGIPELRRASSYMYMLLCSEVKLEMWKRFPCYRDSSKLLVIEIRTIHHQ